jgi:hypothetical protein
LFTSGTGFWGLGAAATAPLFDGGTLLHQERAAKAAYVQASEQYRSTVLTAFQNVADTLTALEQDADGLKAAAAAADAAKVTLDLAQRQLQDGYAGYLALLSAEQAYQQGRINLMQAQANRYADTAALFQALGGGWWHRADLSKDNMKINHLHRTNDARLRNHRERRFPCALAVAVMAVAAAVSSPAAHPKWTRSRRHPAADGQQCDADAGAAAEHPPLHTSSIQISQDDRTTGAVDFDNDQATSVLAPFSGPVSRLLVSPVTRSRKGGPLAVVDSPDFAAAVSAYRKALATARTNRRLADLDKDLIEHQGVAQREAEQAKPTPSTPRPTATPRCKELVSLNVDRRPSRTFRPGGRFRARGQ